MRPEGQCAVFVEEDYTSSVALGKRRRQEATLERVCGDPGEYLKYYEHMEILTSMILTGRLFISNSKHRLY